MLNILLIFFVCTLVVSYFLFDRDIIHPAVVFNFMFTTSVSCAMYNVDRWKINLHQNTFWILIAMAMEFLLVSYAIKLYFKKKNKEQINESYNDEKDNIKNWKLIIVIIFDLIYIAGIVYFVQKIAAEFGHFNSYAEALRIFKANTVYKANARLPKVITFATKFVISFAYIYMFIGIKKFIESNDKLIKRVGEFTLYMIPPVLYALTLLLQSSRGSILRLIFAGIVIYIILWYRKNKFEKVVKFKNMALMFVIGFMMLFSFYSVSSLIGRDTLNNSMLQYMTMYGGGSIQLFDMYLQNPTPQCEVKGIETFWGEYRFLDDYHIIKLKHKPTGSLEWRKSNGFDIGNVYTAYRRWIHDFGLVGCVIILLIVCLFYNIVYNILKSKKSNNKYNLLLLFYAYMYYHLILISIDCRIFDELIPASLSQFVVSGLVYFYAIKNDWKNSICSLMAKIKEKKG